MFRFVWRDLVRNPLRTLAALTGVALGVGLFASVLFFDNGSSASLTRRALAPLNLDMQRVLTGPLGRVVTLSQRLVAAGPLAAGDDVTVILTVVNHGATPANEVVINDEPPPPLTYLHGTTTVGGVLVPDVVGQSPLAQGLARTGLNVGTVAAGASLTATYVARASEPVDNVAVLAVRATVSTRENVVPVTANTTEPIALEQLVKAIGEIPGIASADGLTFVDLPPGSLRAGTTSLDRPVRLFAFSARYAEHYPSIELISGAWEPDAAVLSVEAARTLHAQPAASISLSLPTGPALELPLGGIADLARATPLFASRKSSKLDDFLYVPDAIIVSPAMFAAVVIPAFRAATSDVDSVLRSSPVAEVDVLVDRSVLPADPGRSLGKTVDIASAVNAVAPGQDYLIDNISNVLAVAEVDAGVGRRMLGFLGLPGVLAGVFLATYAARILAATQRRDLANLRMRGAQPRHLRSLIVWRSAMLAGAGSMIGTIAGGAATLAAIGSNALFSATTTDLVTSAGVAAGGGVVCCALALYLVSRQWNRSEIGVERSELAVDLSPWWRRRQLDLILLVGVAAAEAVAWHGDLFHTSPTSVALGESPSLPLVLLVGPVVAWLGGTLLAVRFIQWLVVRLPLPRPPSFGPLVRGMLTRSLRRRSWAMGTGVTGVALVVAFGANLVIFAATYDAAKAADARFVVGSDVRITPSVVAASPLTSEDAPMFEGGGIRRVSPVVYQPENALLIGRHDQDRADLAAIDPAGFAEVAPLSDSLFAGGSTIASMTALAADPAGVLVNARIAEDLSISTGDRVKVVVARGTDDQAVADFMVVGQFAQFPGFPQGVDLIIDLVAYERFTGLRRIDFFLGRTVAQSPQALAMVSTRLQSGPGKATPINIDSTTAALGKDQSSLTAFNLRALLRLDLLFAGLMSAAGIAMFVFALVLARRREYILLRANGITWRELHRLVRAETCVVAIFGVLIGTVVGGGVARLFVYVLRPLFTLRPTVVMPLGHLGLLGAIPLITALLAARGATSLLWRLDPEELLRES